MESTTLYLKDEKSDKVYQVAMEPEGVASVTGEVCEDGYVVTVAYGRKGAKLTVATKTDGAVSEAEARAVYDRLVKEKASKGYVPFDVARPKWVDDSSEPEGPTAPCGFTGPYAPKRWKNLGIKPSEACDDDENAVNRTAVKAGAEPSTCRFTYETGELGGIVRRLARFQAVADASGVVTFDYRLDVEGVVYGARHYLRVHAEADRGAVEVTPVDFYEDPDADPPPTRTFEGSVSIPVVRGRPFGLAVGGRFCGDGAIQGVLTVSRFSAPARAGWNEGDKPPAAPTRFPAKILPLSKYAPVVRTDFSDDAGWEALRAAVLEPNADVDDLVAEVLFVDDRDFEGVSAEQLASTAHNGQGAWLLFVADRETFAHPDRPVLAVDTLYEPGLASRVLPKLVGITAVQISEQNADYDECTEGAGPDGVVRG